MASKGVSFRSGLLEPEVVRSLLVLLVGLTGSGDSLFAEDGEHSGNSLSNSLYQIVRVDAARDSSSLI